MTSRLGTGKWLTFFTVYVVFCGEQLGRFISESRHKAHRYQMYNCTCTAGCGTSLRGNGVNSTTGCGLQMAATKTGCGYNHGCGANRVRLQLGALSTIAATTTRCGYNHGCGSNWARAISRAALTGCGTSYAFFSNISFS